MECRLVNVSSGMEEMYPLREGETRIGRESDNNIQIIKANISRHHARITNMPSVCQLEDLGSANGTFVAGEKIKVAVLRDGDEVRFADEAFRFESRGSVGAEDVFAAQRNYSSRVQIETVRIKQREPETKVLKAVSTLPPLKMKK